MKTLEGQPRVALVIGSGGLKCAAVIGVMKVLEEENIEVDLVVGCSGGSVFGAAIALGFSSEQMIKTSAQTWTEDVTKKIDFSSILKVVSPKLYGFDDFISLFDDSVMAGNIETAFGKTTTFADTRIPLYCVATDFHTGEPVVISEGTVSKAVRISSGIPIVFKPVDWNGRLLIDGGLSNPLPVDVAIQEGADIIIAIGFETPLQPSVTSPGSYAMQMFNILVNQLLSTLFGYYNEASLSEIIAIVPEFKEEIRVNDISKVPFIIQQGEMEARQHISYLKRLLNSATKN